MGGVHTNWEVLLYTNLSGELIAQGNRNGRCVPCEKCQYHATLCVERPQYFYTDRWSQPFGGRGRSTYTLLYIGVGLGGLFFDLDQ